MPGALSGGTGAQGTAVLGIGVASQKTATRTESASRAYAIPGPAAPFSASRSYPLTKKSKAWRDSSWRCPRSKTAAAMKKPEVRAALISEGRPAGDLKKLAPMLHPLDSRAPRPRLRPKRGAAQLAEAEGKDPVEVYVGPLLAEGV